MKDKSYSIVGAGSHGMVVCDLLQDSNYTVSGFFDDNEKLCKDSLLGFQVLGTCNDLKQINKENNVTIIAVGHNQIREKIEKKLNGFIKFGILIHRSATVSKTAKIGEGSMILSQVHVGTLAKVGKHVIINNGTVVEHECIIEDYVSISPGCQMAGGVTIKKGTFVSVGVTINPGVVVGKNCIIGSGSTVISDIPDNSLVYGTPGKIIRKTEDMDNIWSKLL
jgi:acetyltransferase EpsM